jgi:hypothetical protein
VATRFVPRTDPCKLGVVLVAVAAAAGCANGRAESQKVVEGTGYTFSAPTSWQVVRSARQTQAVEGKRSLSLVAVSRFPLRRSVGTELTPEIMADLDHAADQIASQQSGSLTESGTESIAEREARRYKIAYDLRGKKVLETLAFVLRGKTEYLLLCRHEQSASSDACDLLLASFRLT